MTENELLLTFQCEYTEAVSITPYIKHDKTRLQRFDKTLWSVIDNKPI